MKKTLLWMGVAFLLLAGAMVIFAMVGTRAINLDIQTVPLAGIQDGPHTLASIKTGGLAIQLMCWWRIIPSRRCSRQNCRWAGSVDPDADRQHSEEDRLRRWMWWPGQPPAARAFCGRWKLRWSRLPSRRNNSASEKAADTLASEKSSIKPNSGAGRQAIRRILKRGQTHRPNVRSACQTGDQQTNEDDQLEVAHLATAMNNRISDQYSQPRVADQCKIASLIAQKTIHHHPWHWATPTVQRHAHEWVAPVNQNSVA